MPSWSDGPETEAVYLDYAATAPLRPEVWAAMEEARDRCFNPASAHAFGRRANACLEESRGTLAEILGAGRAEVFFTGGGTQSDNLAILGFVRAHRDGGRPPRVLVSSIEHKACIGAAERAREEGAEVVPLPVDADGTVELDALDRALDEGDGAPTLVSLMWANNEVGTVQPVAEAAERARARGARFHTDAVQAFGKLPVTVQGAPADLLTITAHKVGGPVGIGLLYRRKGVALEPLTYGGSQERGVWPGTQNPLGAVGFATAARLAVEEREEEAARLRGLRDALAERLRAGVPDVRIHGEGAPERLPNVLSIGIPDCDAATLLVTLDMSGIAVSGGSACSSGASGGSHVLEAMGIGQDEDYAALRFSMGPATTRAHVERAAEATVRACARLMGTAA